MNKTRLRLFLTLALFSMCFTSAAAQYSRTGKASYYHDKFVGRKTASGIRFSNDSMFCAHRTLPFGTLLEVTNLRNGRFVIVRVVDRGPFIRGRIIDLSTEAARRLGFLSNGVANVKIEVTKRVVLPFVLKPDEMVPTIHTEPPVNTNVRTPYWREIRDLKIEEQ